MSWTTAYDDDEDNNNTTLTIGEDTTITAYRKVEDDADGCLNYHDVVI